MNENEYTKLHICQLYILKEIMRICNRHNIKYFLTGGSLRGAYSIHGILPNDDDIDVGLYRDDYNKFIRVASKELKNDFELRNWDTEKNFGYYYSKILLNGTDCGHDGESPDSLSCKVFVDVVPYENMPCSKFTSYFYDYKLKILGNLLRLKNGYAFPFKKRIILYLLNLLHFNKNPQSIVEKINKTLTNINLKNISSPNMICYCGGHSVVDFFKKSDDLFISFEKISVPVKSDSVIYLKRVYGENYKEISNIKKAHFNGNLKINEGVFYNALKGYSGD